MPHLTDREAAPFFYANIGTSIVKSNSIDSLIKKLPTITLNESALARFLLEDMSHPEETIFNEIKKIPVSAQALPFFSLNDEENDEEKITAWGTRLESHLLTILQKNDKIGFFVSGGLDSCGLLAIAHHLKQTHQLPVKIEVFHLETNHSESDDQGFLKILAEEMPYVIHRCQVTPEELVKIYDQWRTNPTSNPFFPTLQMFLPLMQKAAERSCNLLIFGYGADEQWTFASHTLAYDLLTKAHFKELSLLAQQCGPWPLTQKVSAMLTKKALPTPCNVLLQRYFKRELPPHFRSAKPLIDAARSLHRKVRYSTRYVSGETRRQFFLRNVFSGNSEHNLVCHREMANFYGLRVSFPYLHDELLRLSSAISPQTLFHLQDKAVLRNLLKGKLPEPIRCAPKFQDYSVLAHNTALQLKKHTPHLLMKKGWLPKNLDWQKVGDDAFCEILFVEKMMHLYGEHG